MANISVTLNEVHRVDIWGPVNNLDNMRKYEYCDQCGIHSVISSLHIRWDELNHSRVVCSTNFYLFGLDAESQNLIHFLSINNSENDLESFIGDSTSAMGKKYAAAFSLLWILLWPKTWAKVTVPGWLITVEIMSLVRGCWLQLWNFRRQRNAERSSVTIKF